MFKFILPLAVATSANADILTLDGFADGAFSETVTAGNLLGQQAAGTPGGQRDTAIGVGTNPFDSDLTVTVNPDVGLVYAAGPGVSGFVALQYDGADDVEGDDLPFNPDGGLSLDISGFTSLDFEFLFLDIPMGIHVELANVAGGDIVAASELELIVDDVALPTIYSFDLADFVGDADLADVNAITITYNSQENFPAARDFVVRGVEFVPAPGSLALLALGGVALTNRRRAR